MLQETWIALLSGIFGGSGLTALTNYLLTRQRDKNAGDLAARQQPIDHWAQIVENLERRLDRNDKDHTEEIRGIVSRLDKCQEGHLECERKQGKLEGKIELLTAMVMNKPEGPQVLIATDKAVESIKTETRNG